MLTRFYAKLMNMNEEGQGLVEYALIVFLVSIACFITLQALGIRVDAIFADIKAKLGG